MKESKERQETATQRCCKSLFKMANSCHDILKLTLAFSAVVVVAVVVLLAVVVVVMLGINYERR